MKYLLCLLLSLQLLASPDEELVDFNSIKDVLKSDKLDEVVKKKEAKRKSAIARKNKRKVSKYDIPGENEIWEFISEVWLIKNRDIIKWNFQKPSYGLEDSFKEFLLDHGYLGVQFKVLIVDSPNIFHFVLPGKNEEPIYLLSLPFIRSLDLSKLELSILLFENFLRYKSKIFRSKVLTKDLKKLMGSNFFKKKLPMTVFDNIHKRYDDIILDKGFNFNEQFKITKQMDRILKNKAKFWNAYYNLIQKIDNLVKHNLLFRNYLKLYPSPEMQLSWLKPNEKNK